jgi:hypothetical protein
LRACRFITADGPRPKARRSAKSGSPLKSVLTPVLPLSRLSTIRKLAEALDIDPHEILEED